MRFQRWLSLVVLPVVLLCGPVAPLAGQSLLDRANLRVCRANMRLIAALLEAGVEHDELEDGRPLDVCPLDLSGVLEDLKDEGHLHAIPTCPATAVWSTRYFLLAEGSVFCPVHGLAHPPEGCETAAPRQQLRVAGVTAERALHLASAQSPISTSSKHLENVLVLFYCLAPWYLAFAWKRERAWPQGVGIALYAAMVFVLVAADASPSGLYCTGGILVVLIFRYALTGWVAKPMQEHKDQRPLPLLRVTRYKGGHVAEERLVLAPETQVHIPLPPMVLSLDEAQCPVCGGGFQGDEALLCSHCSTPHHRACWFFARGCAVFGCAAQGVGSNGCNDFEVVEQPTACCGTG